MPDNILLLDFIATIVFILVGFVLVVDVSLLSSRMTVIEDRLALNERADKALMTEVHQAGQPIVSHELTGFRGMKYPAPPATTKPSNS